MRRFILLIFCVFLCAFEKAEDIAYSKEWLALIHYQPSVFFKYTATIGSPDFYLSDKGKHNPKAELEATIELFENSGDDEKKCLFPARYLFLKKNNLVQKPFPKCAEYEKFTDDLRPSGVTLLFTDAYMNNSSSLFGHTLFRIDTSRKGTQLLAHGVNYGAFTRGFEDSPLYAIYGLLGFFEGGLTTKPYYDIINTYNNIENRDIWEYNLDLSEDELDFFVAHIWEIGHTMTPYYFFSRNCSYMLMEILDAVKPQLRLADMFKGYTIPLDTIKAVNQKGAVKSVNYRPSRANKIKHRLKQMNKAQYKAFLDLKNDNKDSFENLKDEEKADVLETAYQYVQYQYVKKKLDLKTYRQKSFALLKERNQNKAGQTFDDLKEGQNPVFSHNSGQIALGVGLEDGNGFEEFVLRPAYHSLTDNPQGYLKGAAINFLETHVRHLQKGDKYVLDKLHVLELVSLSPIDRVFKAKSYRLNVDVARDVNLKDDKRGYISKAELALGGTYALTDNFWIYALGALDGAYGGFIKDNAYIGISPVFGALYAGRKVSFNFEIKKGFATARMGDVLTSKASASYHILQNTDIELSYKRQNLGGKHLDETALFVKYFF